MAGPKKTTNEDPLQTTSLTDAELLELQPLSLEMGYYAGEDARLIFNVLPHETRSTFLWRNAGAGVVVICETEHGAQVIRAKRFDQSWKSTFGGAVEPQETFLQAAMREAKEEWFHRSLGEFEIQDFVHLNRGRRIQDGKLRGFDYVTGIAKIQCSLEVLDNHIAVLKDHALHALAALDALTQPRRHFYTSSKNRNLTAKYALEDTYLMSCIAHHEHGPAAIATLEQIACGKMNFRPIEKFADPRSHAVLNFTEFSDFEIKPLEQVHQIIVDAESGINTQSVFKLDPFSVSGLLAQYN